MTFIEVNRSTRRGTVTADTPLWQPSITGSVEPPDAVVWQFAGPVVDIPVPVLVPAAGSPLWRDLCSVCLLTRAECPLWEQHEMRRRADYAEARGIPYRLDRCGECGGGLGPDAVQRDGGRYCCVAHAQPYRVSAKGCCEVFLGEVCSCADDAAIAAWLETHVFAPSAAYAVTADGTVEVAA